MDNFYCSFFGHRKVDGKEEVFEILLKEIENLIVEKGVKNFYFGGFGDFDDLAHKATSLLMKKHTSIKRIYVLTDERHLRIKVRPKYISQENYEDVVYFQLENNYWYTRIYFRNREIIKRSNYAIFYCKEEENSGAYKILKFAKSNKITIKNLFK